MHKTMRALKFLFIGPMVLIFLTVINYLTSPGEWWIQWPALGIGIAWIISLFRVVWGIILAGGIAALFAVLSRRSASSGP